MMVWALTRLEVVSAIRRLVREGMLDAKHVSVALGRIDALERRWAEVTSVELVRERAERALAIHPLRAADALQLAAALVQCAEKPRRRRFITADDQLAAAAVAEGFDVIVPATRVL
jgi:predicted nucleic acid-binding protein